MVLLIINLDEPVNFFGVVLECQVRKIYYSALTMINSKQTCFLYGIKHSIVWYFNILEEEIVSKQIIKLKLFYFC
jgi:hypothetical protein